MLYSLYELPDDKLQCLLCHQLDDGLDCTSQEYSLEIQFLLKRNYIFSNSNFTIIGQSKKVLHLALLFVRMSGQMNERMR